MVGVFAEQIKDALETLFYPWKVKKRLPPKGLVAMAVAEEVRSIGYRDQVIILVYQNKD